MWYWRQLLKGIPVGIVTEALGHKMIAARAIGVGCIVWFVYLGIYPSLVFESPSGPVVGFDILNALFNARPHMGVWAALWSPVALSLFVPSDATVFQLWIQVVLPLVAWTVCGWIVTRVDFGRPHRDLAPLFAGFILLLHLVLTVPGLTWFLAEVRRNPVGPSGGALSIEAGDLVAPTVANGAISVFGILLGGSVRRSRADEVQS
jgi:hypothetical protein